MSTPQNAEIAEVASIGVSLTDQHAKAGDLEDLAGLVNRWTKVLDGEDKRLDRRIDWTQAQVAHLWWGLIALTLACCVLAAVVIWLEVQG